jgi:hypothetical protein
MADTLFIIPIQVWFWGMVFNIALRLWMANRAGLLAGLMLEVLNSWIINELFGPAISNFTFLSEGMFPTFFSIAVILLGLSYVLAPFFQIRVVHWQKALGWLLFALLFYQFGPGLYVEGESLRRAISSELYGDVLAQANSAPTASYGMDVLNDIAAGPDAAMGDLSNQFGAWVPGDQYVDGLDLAMAYTLSTGDDVVYSLTPLPEDFSNEYFDPSTGPLFFLSMSAQERTDSINEGLTGISRLLLSWVIIFFGLFEQAIYLCLSIAMGMLFLSMAIAILFSFFERTEMMARSLLDMWLELFILSVIISALQALVIGTVTVGARTLNPTLTLGTTLVGEIVMGVLLLKAVRAIWDSMNRLFGAMSQVVGGGLMSPAQAAVAGATALGGAALTIATAGAGAVVAAGVGASAWQVAGSALSGMDSLYSAAAMGSFILPDSSPMKGAASGFYEGALSNRMLGPMGGLMLRGKQEGVDERPAVGSRPSDGANQVAHGSNGHNAPTVVSGSGDLSGIRQAIVGAMNAAIFNAPTGGYSNPQAAAEAVRQALSQGGGSAEAVPYLENRASSIGAHVLSMSRGEISPVTLNITGPAAVSSTSTQSSATHKDS